MSHVWVVSDQDKRATGVFYVAFLRAIIAEVWEGPCAPGVKYAYQDLSVFGFPDKFTAKAGAWLESSGFDPQSDLVLVVFDSEGGGYRGCRTQGASLVRALSRRLAMDPVRIHVSVVEPMSESLYLLDAHCEFELVRWLDDNPKMRPRAGRRRKPSTSPIQSRVGALAGRRRRAPTHTDISMPTKKELYNLVGYDVDKTGLAARMADVVSADAWEIPPRGRFPEFERLRGWLRRWGAPS